jgi:hypothetical protein
MGVALAASAVAVLPMASAQAHGKNDPPPSQGNGHGKGQGKGHGKGHYPPGRTLQVTATPRPNDATHFVVVVTNADPDCQLKVSVHGRDAYPKIGADGTAQFVLEVGPISGAYTIHTQTYACKSIASTDTNVVVTKYKLLGPTSVHAKETFSVQATGWLPSLATTFTISDGKTTLTFPTQTGANGRVTQNVSVPYAGTWAVVVTQANGPTKTYALTVLPAPGEHKKSDADDAKTTTKAGSTPASTPKPTPTVPPKPVPAHH